MMNLDNKTEKSVLMICTGARGGMLSVVEGYKADGVFSRWNVILLFSHVEGGFLLRLSTAIKALARLVLLLLGRQVGLVHIHSAMRSSFWRKSLFAMVSKFFGVPVIFHLHGSELKAFIDEQSVSSRRIIRWILAKQSAVVVLSESWSQYVKSVSPNAKVKVIVNYVNLPQLVGDIQGYTANEVNEVRVLFLGLIGVRKGVYDLLPAFKDALVQVPNLRLIIGGNGEVERARSLAAELEIDSCVEFAGWVSGDLKNDLLLRAHIYVLPSYNEGMPVSLLEAMSWHIPVISTRVGGIPELVRDGIDGRLIDAGDRSALTSALVELAKETGLRRKMGISARERVERDFSDVVVLPKLEELYRSLLDGDVVTSD